MKFFLLLIIAIAYIYYSRSKIEPMSHENQKLSQEEIDKQNFDPDNLIINMGGRQVPLKSINKPHNVILDPSKHKPRVEGSSFPDIEESAREREKERAAAHAESKLTQ